jgi:hypothetical protein
MFGAGGDVNGFRSKKSGERRGEKKKYQAELIIRARRGSEAPHCRVSLCALWLILKSLEF